MSGRWSPLHVVALTGTVGAFGAIAAACGSQSPPGLTGVSNGPDGSTLPSCADPTEGCACPHDGSTLACGSVVNRSGDYVECAMGKRTCANGKWSTCVGQQVTTQYAPISTGTSGGLEAQGLGMSATCGADNPCDPYCNEYVDSPSGIVPPSGFGVGPGGLSLVSTGAGPCTTLTGTIMDPGQVNPVYSANVYVPTTSVAAFTPGVACDTCANLISGSPGTAQAVTGPDGKFKLSGVPAGTPFPLVIQVGRWRRQVTVPAIPMCGTATLAPALAHLPNVHTKTGDMASDLAPPDIPFHAIGTGNQDSVECLLSKMGVATSEFTNPGGGGRFEMYVNNGAVLNGATPPVQTLWDSPAKLDAYQALLMPCNGENSFPPHGTISTPTEQANVAAYINAGGRLFSSHYTAVDFVYGPFNAAATWDTVRDTLDQPPPNLTATVDQTTTTGMDFATWLMLTGASTTLGQLSVSVWRHDVDSLPAESTRWLYGSSPHGEGNMVSVFSFDTPLGAPAATQCGRVVVPEMHVSNLSNGTFPAECSGGPMTPQEEAFEFLLFQTTACLSNSPPPPPLTAETFTRTFQAMCPVGTHVSWEFFSWEATIPTGTNITFTAQTASTLGGLATAPAVSAGLANFTTTTWTSDPNTIAWHLANDVMPAQQSQEYLQINMKFDPLGTTSPSLLNWRQMYDCPPTE